MNGYAETLARFESIARNKPKNETMAALIIDSPWLPGFAGQNTIDFFFETHAWLAAYEKAHAELPGTAFVPGSWVEFGMAAEPSGWGAGMRWSADSPPSILPYPGGLAGLLDAKEPDPERDGLMPVILRRYESLMPELKRLGTAPRMAAARGPLAIASHLMGMTEFLMATQLEPDRCLKLLDVATSLCTRWLSCQLKRMDDPIGVLVLDDVVGMMGPSDAERFAFPLLKRIFDAYPDLIRIYHNDTPNKAVYKGLSGIGMDVFNLSHEIDLQEARSLLGPDVVLMGNIPPLDVLLRGAPALVREKTEELLCKASIVGPLLISPGGGVSPGTPIENLAAMIEAVQR